MCVCVCLSVVLVDRGVDMDCLMDVSLPLLPRPGEMLVGRAHYTERKRDGTVKKVWYVCVLLWFTLFLHTLSPARPAKPHFPPTQHAAAWWGGSVYMLRRATRDARSYLPPLPHLQRRWCARTVSKGRRRREGISWGEVGVVKETHPTVGARASWIAVPLALSMERTKG